MDKQQPQQGQPKQKKLTAITLIHPFIYKSPTKKKHNTIMTPDFQRNNNSERCPFFEGAVRKHTCNSMRPPQQKNVWKNRPQTRAAAPPGWWKRTEPPCPPGRRSSRHVWHLEVRPTLALRRSHLNGNHSTEWLLDRFGCRKALQNA